MRRTNRSGTWRKNHDEDAAGYFPLGQHAECYSPMNYDYRLRMLPTGYLCAVGHPSRSVIVQSRGSWL